MVVTMALEPSRADSAAQETHCSTMPQATAMLLLAALDKEDMGEECCSKALCGARSKSVNACPCTQHIFTSISQVGECIVCLCGT